MKVEPREERRDDQLWRLIRQKVGDPKRLGKMNWSELAKVARELGFEDYARAWENSQVGAR